MKGTLLVFAVVAALGGAGAAGVVVDLTDATFEKETQAETGKGGTWMVMFYAKWCAHCTAMMAEFEGAAALLADRGVKAARVNCPDNANSKSRFTVHGYPTVLVLKDGYSYFYGGAREADAMAWFATEGVKLVTADSEHPPEPIPSDASNVVVGTLLMLGRDLRYVWRQLVPKGAWQAFQQKALAVGSVEDLKTLAAEESWLLFLVVFGGVLAGVTAVMLLMYCFTGPAPDPAMTRRVVQNVAKKQTAADQKKAAAEKKKN